MGNHSLLVISGASGVGKSTVLHRIFAALPQLQFSVSATTRPPRPGERDGVDYAFLTREEFHKRIAKNEFVEYDEHDGNLYGTPWKELDKANAAPLLLDIEPMGALSVKERRPDAVLIFVTAPMEEIARRLSERGDTPPEQIAMRLRRAEWEIAQAPKYDYIVTNDQVDTCAEEIISIIAREAEISIGGN
ncbi:MAG: guanylate kinase [Firmicutes bacterium]|nr:guanylate kinase [Bacillota bacterium]